MVPKTKCASGFILTVLFFVLSITPVFGAGQLEILEPEVYLAGGLAGGPFSPSQKTYTLRNSGDSSLGWTVTSTAPAFSATPSSGTLAAGASVEVIVRPATAASGLAAGTHSGTLVFTNTSNGNGNTTRNAVLTIAEAAVFPYFQNFDDSGLPPHWTVGFTGQGRINLDSTYESLTGQAAVMDDAVADGNPSRQELTLGVDLTGQQNVFLCFNRQEWNDTDYTAPTSWTGEVDADAVAVSPDGINWYRVFRLEESWPIWVSANVSLDHMLRNTGVQYGPNFRIRFQHYGDGPVPSGGIGIDDVMLVRVGGFPFEDTFDDGALSSYWLTHSTGNGRIEHTATHGRPGSKHLLLHDPVADGNPSLNEVSLALNLRFQYDVRLTFDWKSLPGETQDMGGNNWYSSSNQDCVAVSMDGIKWYKAYNFSLPSTEFQRAEIDLFAIAQANSQSGLRFDDCFFIRIQQFSNGTNPNNGIIIDNVAITTAAGMPTPYPTTDPPTAAPTSTRTHTPTFTRTNTPTPTFTRTHTPTHTYTAVPTATPTLDHTDTDGDRIPDRLEEKFPSEGKTNMYLVDTDGDGLSDGFEDANQNGTCDPGELNPRNRDSDGDGYPDGMEILLVAGNPLDRNSPVTPWFDADGDDLPPGLDPDDHTPDFDGDRFLDGYEAVIISLPSVSNSRMRPPLGDVNADGTIDNADAQCLMNWYGNQNPDIRLDRGNVNRDAFLDNADAHLMMSFFGRTQTYLPVE